MKLLKLLLLAVASILINNVQSYISYTVTNYPNPQRYDTFQACHIDQRDLLCDPEEVLNSTERVQLAQMLYEFQSQTHNPAGKTPCKKKGTSVAIAISRQPITGTTQKPDRHGYGADVSMTSEEVAQTLLNNWLIDEDCHKAMIILVPVDNIDQIGEYHFKQVPLVETEIEHVFHTEMPVLQQQRKYMTAFADILNSISRSIVAKQSMLSGATLHDVITTTQNTTAALSTVSTPTYPPTVGVTTSHPPLPVVVSKTTTLHKDSDQCTTTSSLFWTVFWASSLSSLVIACILLALYTIVKKSKGGDLLRILRNAEPSSSSRNCEQQPVYMTQISDCEDS